ncbi:hypothetical protein DKX38_003673 [Salix brachista]|uniref:Uncharacterized protein n=1 Tax=Salix brachista TaxID=2182728 RepID=A0A5N5NQI4_9ROSI|nr:hypothetical protein DKX38_003673 [Salix brachista]
MGKSKKPQKTKELSVAIAEASSTGDPETRQQSQTPRKRGRPRKIIEKSESVVKKEESTAEGAQATHEQEARRKKMGNLKGRSLQGEAEGEKANHERAAEQAGFLIKLLLFLLRLLDYLDLSSLSSEFMGQKVERAYRVL